MRTLVLAAAIAASLPAAPPPSRPTAVRTDPLASIRAGLLSHAPYKQWDIATGLPNAEIGRAPGAACEAASFLARDARGAGGTASRRKAVELADWVADLQDAQSDRPVPDGVPSTPDLDGAAGSYHYSIDAALCGAAMTTMADLTGDRRYDRSAHSFGRFLLSMMRDGTGVPMAPGAPGRALCEAVVQQPGEPAAWNCRRYVKSLVALPFLAAMDRAHPGEGYAAAARDLRASLLPGLRGLWEYADGPTSSPVWHRIDGPEGQRDLFVYGDTLSYALKGLHAYEGTSAEVRSLYADFGRPRAKDPRTRRYDPGVAYAGYVVADRRAADPFSGYYDIVTLGLMRPVRHDVSPADLRRADAVMLKRIDPLPVIGWHMDMQHRVRSQGMADASTLAALGEATIDATTAPTR